MAFVRFRVPETGAHISLDERAHRVHPRLVRLDRPATDTPTRTKHRKPIAAPASAPEPKE